MQAKGASDEVVNGVMALFDAMSEQHARVLFRFKQELRQRYGRKSEQISDAQLELLFELFQKILQKVELPDAVLGPAGLLQGDRGPRSSRHLSADARGLSASYAALAMIAAETAYS